MNQLEMAKKAKNYMDKLAQGIDPISGETLPENDTLNQLPLARCFFYVSQVLGQVIENGGQVGVYNQDSLPDFILTPEQLRTFTCSSTPLTISQLTEAINQLPHAHPMKKLSPTMVTNWLLYRGYLEQQKDLRGKNQRVPTLSGKEIGLELLAQPEHPHGRSIVLYHATAQQFVIDHLPQMIYYHKKKK